MIFHAVFRYNLKQEVFYNLLMFIKKRSANPMYFIAALTSALIEVVHDFIAALSSSRNKLPPLPKVLD